jgi:protein phosphatase
MTATVTAGRTDVGRVREANEDFLADFERPSGHRLLVVADGMGGHRGGATASRLCVETLGESFRRSSDEPEVLLREALGAANERIQHEARNDMELSGMGTTAVALLLTPEAEAWVAHLGDSRAYLLRDGVLRRLTDDHTVVAAMIQRGVLDPGAAETHPRRHELVRCVGFHDEVSPEITRIDVLPGDRFLLCSDGLSGQVPEEEICSVLLRESPADAADALVAAANAAGGRDNVSVLVGAVPGGATTVVDRMAPQLPVPGPAGSGTSEPDRDARADAGFAARLAAERGQAARQQRHRRLAALTSVVAAVLALGVLWLTLH